MSDAQTVSANTSVSPAFLRNASLDDEIRKKRRQANKLGSVQIDASTLPLCGQSFLRGNPSLIHGFPPLLSSLLVDGVPHSLLHSCLAAGCLPSQCPRLVDFGRTFLKQLRDSCIINDRQRPLSSRTCSRRTEPIGSEPTDA